MNTGFLVQLHSVETGGYTGIVFESSDLGGEVPRVGDTIISPLTKKDFDPRNLDTHSAFEIVNRYFVPDITKAQANIVKLLVKRRSLSNAERALFNK